MATDRTDLDTAIKRAEAVQADYQRLQGRLESARADQATVEADCRERGVEPEQLDAAIAKLEARYDAGVSDLQDRVGKAEAALKPFLGED